MSLIDYHRKMLADSVRTEAFTKALKSVIKPGETIVADIGSGTGVLSFLALKLGAKHAILYEAGDVIELSKTLAKDLGFFEKCTFVHKYSFEVQAPKKADLVISETLGNFALEEHLLEILGDAKRFLALGGTTIPSRLTQVVTPVTSDVFLRELQSWRTSPFDFSSAEALSLQNVYVRTFSPKDLLVNEKKVWDEINFSKKESSERTNTLTWKFSRPTAICGFCLSWSCELTPGVSLTTHPWDSATHWEQIYLPIPKTLSLLAGDELQLLIASDTRLSAGINVQWEVRQKRGEKILSLTKSDMQKGFLA